MVFNRRVDNGCSSRRPDVFMDCLTHSVIVECDEDQHKGYSCENKRLMEIFQDLGSRPLVIIRLNPDAFKDVDGKRVTSCFGVHKRSGTFLVTNKKQWELRLTALEAAVRTALAIVPEREITTAQLFYDGYACAL